MQELKKNFFNEVRVTKALELEQNPWADIIHKEKVIIKPFGQSASHTAWLSASSVQPFSCGARHPHEWTQQQGPCLCDAYIPVGKDRQKCKQLFGALEPGNNWDAWVAQSVKCLTLAQVMLSGFVSSSPGSGSVLTAQSLAPASDSVSLSLSAPPLLTDSLSLPEK